MVRRAARIDANQPEIVAALESCGVKVQSLAAVGKGVADLLCCKGDRVFLIEVKDGSRPPSERRLTPAQVAWHRDWPVTVVETVEGAIALTK